MRFGTYAPQNLDRAFLGPISARTALQASRNLPAVALLDAVGPAQLLARLGRAGATPRLPPGGAPGPRHRPRRRRADARGPRRGSTPPSPTAGRRCRSPKRPAPRPAPAARLLDAAAAWHVADVLRGTPPPAERRGRTHRLQDRHQLRPPRRLGDRLRRRACGRRSGSGGRTARRCPARSASKRPRRRSSTPSPGSSPEPEPLPPPPASALTVAAPQLPPPSAASTPAGRPTPTAARRSPSRPTAPASIW